MPEGHTLHRLALDLTEAFGGRVVTVTSPQGRFAESAAALDQTLFVEATAHGKHLFCEFDDDRFLHVHLGLIGKFQLVAPDPTWGEVRVRIATREQAADLRGPQLCVVATRAEIDAAMANLGPDPLRPDADPELAWRRIRRASRPIAALVMDQTILSGVGNVYRAEVLFRNRINPHRPGNKLSRKSWTGIWSDLVELMPRAYATTGSTPSGRSTPRRRWVARRARTVTAARSTSIDGRAWPAWSAARRCGPSCWPGATCSGAVGANAGADLSVRSGRGHGGRGRPDLSCAWPIRRRVDKLSDGGGG